MRAPYNPRHGRHPRSIRCSAAPRGTPRFAGGNARCVGGGELHRARRPEAAARRARVDAGQNARREGAICRVLRAVLRATRIPHARQTEFLPRHRPRSGVASGGSASDASDARSRRRNHAQRSRRVGTRSGARGARRGHRLDAVAARQGDAGGAHRRCARRPRARTTADVAARRTRRRRWSACCATCGNTSGRKCSSTWTRNTA